MLNSPTQAPPSQSAKGLFPYTRVDEHRDAYFPGNERFELNYIEREALLLIHFLRSPTKDRFGDLAFNIRLDDRDNRILRRWGVK